MSGFDDEETPLPAAPDVPPEKLLELRVAADLVLAEHEELVQLRLKCATLQAKADELERELVRREHQVRALSARVVRESKVTDSLKLERDSARKDANRMREEMNQVLNGEKKKRG